MRTIRYEIAVILVLAFCLAETLVLRSVQGEGNPDNKADSAKEYWVGEGRTYYRADGQKAICREFKPNIYTISICDIQKGQKTNIKELISLKGENASISYVFVPTDGKRIIYIMGNVGIVKEYPMWEIDHEGNNKKQLGKIPAGANVISFSPDGKQVVWAGEEEGQNKRNYSYLGVANTDGSGIKKFAKSKPAAGQYATPDETYLSPQFIPGTNKIIFISMEYPEIDNAPSRSRIYTMEIGKENKTEIDTKGLLISDIKISPDGKKIAFVGVEKKDNPGKGGGGGTGWTIGPITETWTVMNINGSNIKKFTITGMVLGFSQDGKELLYLNSEDSLCNTTDERDKKDK